MSLYSEKQDKEVLNTLKRIASSLEKIEQHMCANKVNGKSAGSNQEKEREPVPDHKIVMCPICELETVLSKGYLEELDTYGNTDVYCPYCKNLFRINKEDIANGRRL